MKTVAKRNLDLTELEKVIDILSEGKTLPPEYLDHSLTGNMKIFRECHIKPNWLLVYRLIKDRLILSLYATGTHSDIFNS
jgi:mRNA interferase YafQ